MANKKKQLGFASKGEVPKGSGFSKEGQALIDFQVAIAKLEMQCRRVDTAVSMPASIYQLFDQLRAEVGRWGAENVVAVEKLRREMEGD